MKSIIPIRIIALVCWCASAAAAQANPLKDFAGQHVRLWLTPFEQPRQTLKIGTPLAAATAVLLRLDQTAINRYVRQPAPWATRTSHAGDAAALAGSLVALYGVGRYTRDETLRQMSATGASALAHSFLMSQELKAIVRRQRPDGSNHGSMPSGHAMTSFALAGALTAHPRAPRWLRVAAPLAAGAISFSRVGARKHYPSDVALGATLGWLMGRATKH